MNIHTLRLELGDADCDALTRRLMPPQSPLEDLRVEIRPEGVCVKGAYPLFVSVSFESWWQLTAVEGKLSATLTKLKAFGMPGMVFKSAIMKVLREVSAKHQWLEVRGDDALFDVEALLTRELCPTRMRVHRIVSGHGMLVLEAGA
jgi:hypothetical protein